MTEDTKGWSEENSRDFIDYGRYFVPGREEQIRAICDLVPAVEQAGILELCCGEGLLAQALLERLPGSTVLGLDGSHEMLEAARLRLEPFGERFRPGKFDLSAADWRGGGERYHAVVSSLAIHHLDGPAKAQLFRDVFTLLRPGGAFIVADVILPAGPKAAAYAAGVLDETVREQSLKLDGDQKAFEWFQRAQWNLFRYPEDPVDRPSTLFDQLQWLTQAGFEQVDVFWMRAGHAVFGGYRPD